MGLKNFLSSLFKNTAEVETTIVSDIAPEKIECETRHVDDINSLCIACFSNDTEWFNEIMSRQSTNNLDVNGSVCHSITPIIYASFYGNLDIVRTLIEHGANLNIKDTFHEAKRSPLIYAAYKGHIELAALLIENGATLNETDFRNYSALMIATEMGNYEIAEILIKQGANLDITSNSGLTALMIAAKKKQAGIAKLLIDNEAALNEISISKNTYNRMPKNTALHFAAECNAFEVAALLLEAKADFTIEDDYGKKPIDLAVSAGHPEIIECFIRHGETLNLSDKALISDAFRFGHLRLAKFLMKYVSDINFMVPPEYDSGATDRTPFTIAVNERDAELVDLIVSKGVVFDINNHACDRLLYRAARYGHDEAIKVLVEAGIDIEATMTGSTPLSAALHGGHENTVKLLIELGANIHVIGEYGSASTLMDAVKIGNKVIVETLIQSGVDINYTTEYKQTALTIALTEGDKDIIEFLIENHARVDDFGSCDELEFMLAAQDGDQEVLKSLLTKGVPVDGRNEDDITALTVAVRYNQLGSVKLLLENGADINASSSLLSATINNDSIEIVDLLLSSGADVNQFSLDDGALLLTAINNKTPQMAMFLINNGTNLNGVTVEGNAQIGEDYRRHLPLSRAAEKGYYAVVELLIQKGADVNARDHDGNTALKGAAQNGHVDAVKVLLENGADANLGNYIEYVPMMWAADEGHIDIVRLLIEYGGNVSYQNPNNSQSPMKIAYDKENLEIVDILMLAGAEHSRRY